jgi:hypothetical protein
MEVMSAPRRIADDPSREPTDEWIRQARHAIAEVLPGLVDDATRDALIARMLQLPRQERAEMVRSARRLVGGYNTLRWSARRVLLQAVAEERLGRQRKPSRSPTWQVLARLTRTPARRLTGDVGRGVLLHDALPQCPTARAWVDE